MGKNKQSEKRKRELDTVEEQLLEEERLHHAPQHQSYVEELQKMAAQSITPEDKERALAEIKAEQEAEKQRKERIKQGLEDDDEVGWDVNVLREQFNSGGMRRQWEGGPLNLHNKLEDCNLAVERVSITVAKSADPADADEEEQWAWKLTNGRGGVVLHHPSGELRCQGQWTQQLFVRCFLKRFTTPWVSWRGQRGVTDHDADAVNYSQFFEKGGMRRSFLGTDEDLKQCLDWALGDDRSGVTEMPTKVKGCRSFLWRHKKVKGAVRLTTPTQELTFQGNLKQQIALLECMKRCTL